MTRAGAAYSVAMKEQKGRPPMWKRAVNYMTISFLEWFCELVFGSLDEFKAAAPPCRMQRRGCHRTPTSSRLRANQGARAQLRFSKNRPSDPPSRGKKPCIPTPAADFYGR
jgi:hypothetical protein